MQNIIFSRNEKHKITSAKNYDKIYFMYYNVINKNKLINKDLTCIKTGFKAKIINYCELNEVSYVKIIIMMKFEGKNFHVLKTCLVDEIEDQFNYS